MDSTLKFKSKTDIPSRTLQRKTRHPLQRFPKIDKQTQIKTHYLFVINVLHTLSIETSKTTANIRVPPTPTLSKRQMGGDTWSVIV